MNFKELAPGPTDRASDVSHSTAFDASDGASRPIAPTDTSRPGPSESIGAGLRFVPQSRLLGGSGEREVHTMDSEGSERQTADQASPTESVRTDNSIVPPREEVQRIYQEAGVGPDGTKDLGTGDVRNVEFSATLQQSHQDVNGVNQDAGEGDREDNGDGDTILRVNVTDSDEGENDGHELVVEPDADRLLDASGTGGEGGGRDKPPGTGGSEGSDDGIDGENGDSDVNLNGDGNTESIPDDSVIGNANGISEEGTGEQDAALIEIASGDDVPQGTPTEPEPQADNVGGVTGESTETELPSVEDPDPYGIKDVYKNIAVDIVGTLDEGDISVVTGPWRSGKSTTLIPEMVTVLIESGQEVVSTQGFDFMDDSERLVQGLPDLPNRNGVIIVDEAGIPPSNQDQLNETLAALRDKGYTKVVAVLPHHIDAADVGLSDLASIWGRAVNGEGEHDIPMTPIPRAELTNPSAEIFVRDRAEENKLIRPSTDDAIAYVLANVPHTLPAFDSVAGSGDLGQTLNAFYRYLTTAEGSMPETERQQLIAKVGQDRLDLESGIQISIGDGHYQPPDDGRERVFIGKQLIDASDVEDKDEGIQDQHPHDVQEIVNEALNELALERKAGRTGVEGFDLIDKESEEVVDPVDPEVQILVDEALRDLVAERDGQGEGTVVSETAGINPPAQPVDIYFAEGGKVGDAVKFDLPQGESATNRNGLAVEIGGEFDLVKAEKPAGSSVTIEHRDVPEGVNLFQVREIPRDRDLHLETELPAEIDWQKEEHVGLWLPEQIVPATDGIDCIDDRPVVDPEFVEKTPLQIVLEKEGIIPDESILEIPQISGDLKFQGGDFGIATLIEMTTRAGSDTSVRLARDYAKSRGRAFTIHTDDRNVETDPEKGCGLMRTVSENPYLFGFSPTTGRRLVETALDIPSKEGGSIFLSTYVGGHKPSAWINSHVKDSSFRQISKQGNVFLTEPERVKAMLTNPKNGLEKFLWEKGFRVDPELLIAANDHMIDVVQPSLAPNAPLYDVTQDQNGILIVTSRGLITPNS